MSGLSFPWVRYALERKREEDWCKKGVGCGERKLSSSALRILLLLEERRGGEASSVQRLDIALNPQRISGMSVYCSHGAILGANYSFPRQTGERRGHQRREGERERERERISVL